MNVFTILMGLVCAVGTTEPTTTPTAGVSVVAYVPSTTVTAGADLPVVLEVSNNGFANCRLRLSDPAPVERVRRSQVVKAAVPAAARESSVQPVVLNVRLQVVYPDTAEFKAYAVSTRTHRLQISCNAGQSVLVKTRVPRQSFQPGHCSLLVTLSLNHGDGVGDGSELSRAQPVELEVINPGE